MDITTLRSKAHSLNPVVIIGNQGLHEGTLFEINRSLDAHELIKIAIHVGDRKARKSIASEICLQTGATLVQSIGKRIVIWRKNTKESQSSN